MAAVDLHHSAPIHPIKWESYEKPETGLSWAAHTALSIVREIYLLCGPVIYNTHFGRPSGHITGTEDNPKALVFYIPTACSITEAAWSPLQNTWHAQLIL